VEILPKKIPRHKITPRSIHVDERALVIFEGQLPKQTSDRKCNKSIKEYFESKSDASKC